VVATVSVEEPDVTTTVATSSAVVPFVSGTGLRCGGLIALVGTDAEGGEVFAGGTFPAGGG
jgi:hypothetical protein